MLSIQTLYLIMSAAAVVAMAPQIKQLLITKQSDELNLGTWVIWALNQCTALIYSITIHSVPFLLANIAWVSFYAVMLTLIIKYRRNVALEIAQQL